MASPHSMYGDPAVYVERKEFLELGCGACVMHKPKPDRSEFHCLAECRQWPDATNRTCRFFANRKRVRSQSDKDQI